MDNKKELLGALAIDDHQRDDSSNTTRYLITGIGAILLAVLAWFWLVPDITPVNVKTAAAREATVAGMSQSNAVLNGSGFVTARRKATVSSKITGKVNQVFIEEGVAVKEGDILATLDDSVQQANLALSKSQFKASKARLSEVEVQIREAELDLNRTTELQFDNLASEADLDRARLAVDGLRARLTAFLADTEVAASSVEVQQQQLRDTEIRAPFSGVVILKAAQPGEMISPVTGGGGFTATGICTLVDMDSLEIEVDVSESYINRVKPGQKVSATLNSYEDWDIPAEVIAIIPTADRNKATVQVRIAFLERDARIFPEMGVRVAFLEERIEPVTQAAEVSGVFIPANAITTIDGINVVYVVNDTSASQRQVRLGKKQGNNRNVVSGLDKGEKVVLNLNNELIVQLDNGNPVSTE